MYRKIDPFFKDKLRTQLFSWNPFYMLYVYLSSLSVHFQMLAALFSAIPFLVRQFSWIDTYIGVWITCHSLFSLSSLPVILYAGIMYRPFNPLLVTRLFVCPSPTHCFLSLSHPLSSTFSFPFLYILAAATAVIHRMSISLTDWPERPIPQHVTTSHHHPPPRQIFYS